MRLTTSSLIASLLLGSLVLPLSAHADSTSPDNGGAALVAPQQQKDFILEGTMRLGQRQSVVLMTPDSTKLLQNLNAGAPTPIRGYEGYRLISIGSREAKLSYPEHAPCRASSPEDGILCAADGKTATLSLRYASPTAAPADTQSSPDANSQVASVAPPGMRVIHTAFGNRFVPV